MKLWKKRGSNEIIDLTLLQKRGILEKSRNIQSQNTSQNQQTNNFILYPPAQESLPSSSPSSSSPFDLLDSLSQNSQQESFFASSTQNPLSSQNNQTYSSANQDISKEIAHLKTKLDDLEYKFERLIERLSRIEYNFENKQNN